LNSDFKPPQAAQLCAVYFFLLTLFLITKFYIMAHNLNFNNGKHSFFSVKEKAWHGLGQIVQDYPTSKEAIVFAGLDYTVDALAICTAADNLQIKTHFATVRTDTNLILGVVGSKYQIVQNETAFTFFDSLVQDGSGIKYETAGALGNGERIFITAKMPDVLRIGRNDDIEQYIFLTTSHDGSGSIMAAFTPVRIVCNNTLNAALRNNSNAVYIKHTANAEQKLHEAARIISISQTTGEMLEDVFNNWSKIRVSDAETKKLIRLAMAPNKEVFKAIAENNTAFEFSSQFEDVCGKVLEYAMTAETQHMPTTAGTLYGAYNAITGYYQNVNEYKSADAKLKSIMFGTALDRTKSAFEICSKANDFLN
jgi:phage/plasmid-like protein (TIGR03299 family)